MNEIHSSNVLHFFFCRNASPSHLSLTDPTTGNSISSYAPVTWNGNSRCEEKAVGLFPSPHFAPLDLPSPPVFVQVIYRIEFLIKLEYISCFAPFGSPATIFSFTWMCAWLGEKRWKPGSELLRRVDPIPPSEHSGADVRAVWRIFAAYSRHRKPFAAPHHLAFGKSTTALLLLAPFFLTWVGWNMRNLFCKFYVVVEKQLLFFRLSFLVFSFTSHFLPFFSFSHLALWLKLQIHWN